MPDFFLWCRRADQRHVTTTTSLTVVALAIAGVLLLVAWRGGVI